PDDLEAEAELSMYGAPALQAFASMQGLRQRQFDEFDLQVSTDAVFETIAHLVQAQAAWTGQGENSAKALLNFVLTSPVDHLKPLQLLRAALDRGPHAQFNLLRYVELFTWMLLGPWEDLGTSGHPADRFFQVLVVAAQAPNDNVFVGQMSAAQLFDRLDDVTE